MVLGNRLICHAILAGKLVDVFSTDVQVHLCLYLCTYINEV